MTDYSAGDVVRLKSGGPNLVVCNMDSKIVKVAWFDNASSILLRDELHVDLIEPLKDHVEREKNYLAQTQEGLLRLPAGANDDNTIVMAFADPKMKTEMWDRIQAMLPFEAQTIMGGGNNQSN